MTGRTTAPGARFQAALPAITLMLFVACSRTDFLGFAATSAAAAGDICQEEARTQYTVVSFDGLPEERLLDFASRIKARFTFFVSGVFFVPDAERKTYQAPGRKQGESILDFGGSKSDVERAKGLVLRALRDGHEIGSHLNGHFDAVRWSAADWRSEFRFFEEQTAPWTRAEFPEYRTRGFRAPYLRTSPQITDVLREFGFFYNSSDNDNDPVWPNVIAPDLHRLPLNAVRLPHARTKVIAMDYNLRYVHDRARGMTRARRKAETLAAYQALFREAYDGSRSPVQYSHHSSAWADDVYREALLEFLNDVCIRPDVRCVSGEDLIRRVRDCGLPRKKGQHIR